MAKIESCNGAIRITRIALAIVVLLTFLSTNLDAAAAKNKYDCSTVEGLTELHTDLQAQPDGGAGLFDSLSRKCQKAYVDAQSIAYVEVTTGETEAESVSVSAAVSCKDAWVSARHYTYLGNTAYRYVKYQRFCFDGSRITSTPTVWHYIDNVASTYYWRGETTRNQYWDSSSRYYSWRQGRVENCVLKYGCVGNGYPEAWIRSYGSGYWYGGASPR